MEFEIEGLWGHITSKAPSIEVPELANLIGFDLIWWQKWLPAEIVRSYPDKAKENCLIPTCDAKLTILDQWRVTIGKKGTRFRFGQLLKIDLPESSESEEGWSVAIKLPHGEKRATFQVYNGHFHQVYQNENEGLFLLIFGALFVVTQGTAVAPFIYTIF